MTDVPDNVSLDWLARRLVEFREEMRQFREETRRAVTAQRDDMDTLTRMVLRIDRAVDALRDDMRTLWGSQRELRQRIEALEDRER